MPTIFALRLICSASWVPRLSLPMAGGMFIVVRDMRTGAAAVAVNLVQSPPLLPKLCSLDFTRPQCAKV